MSATVDYMEERKRTELAALAAGGERARQEWLSAESATNARLQSSLDAELASARRFNVGAAGEAEISRIISEPHRAAMDSMARRRALDETYTSALSSAEGTYIDRMKGTVPALERELAESMVGSGRGGGGSGGSGSDDDWYKALREDAGGLKSFIPGFLASASRGQGYDRSMPRDLRSRQFAQDAYGVPEFALDQISPIGGFLKTAQEQLARARAEGVGARRYIQDTRQAARATPGDQHKAVQYVASQARQVLPKKKPKKKRG